MTSSGSLFHQTIVLLIRIPPPFLASTFLITTFVREAVFTSPTDIGDELSIPCSLHTQMVHSKRCLPVAIPNSTKISEDAISRRDAVNVSKRRIPVTISDI
ncbi:hypothetical protein NPIL_666081 [Nephila pilipes]|uniref:Uncharacterized protein n=1 Tax=Nephila pilipes TaxID=299642 RepID=A0A8X6P8M5_NEPPI|nr:hypothetical protein NPIL_666081 [Nephila pilipes]